MPPELYLRQPGTDAGTNATTPGNSSTTTNNGQGGSNGSGGSAGQPPPRGVGENLASVLNGIIWLLVGLSLVLLCLRLYCKLIRHRRLWWDDGLLSLSWMALAVSAALLSFATTMGFGRHSDDIPYGTNMPYLIFTTQLAGFFSLLAAWWSKVSFGLTLLRISSGWTRCFVWFVILTVTAVIGLNSGFQMIQCLPVAALWDQSIPAQCLSKTMVYDYNLFAAAWSGTMDICLSFLPWQIIWRVTMNKKEKLGIVLAMSMGVFAGITSIAKTISLGAITNLDYMDCVPLMILATAEGAVTIIAASVPILRPLFQRSSANRSTTPKFVWESEQRGLSSASEVPEKLASPITPGSLPYGSHTAGRQEPGQGGYSLGGWRELGFDEWMRE